MKHLKKNMFTSADYRHAGLTLLPQPRHVSLRMQPSGSSPDREIPLGVGVLGAQCRHQLGRACWTSRIDAPCKSWRNECQTALFRFVLQNIVKCNLWQMLER